MPLGAVRVCRSPSRMNKTSSIALILALAAVSACTVISGKDDDAGAQKPALNLRFVESLRNEKSLRGEGWKEPQYGTSSADSLQQPNSVYADAFRVYVTDTYRSTTVVTPRIFVFDRGNRTAVPLGIPAPPAEGKLLAPAAITVDATGVIYVADPLQGMVFGYDLNGKALSVFGRAGEAGKPTGLAADRARGRLYVADAAAHLVRAITVTGTTLVTVGGTGNASEDFRFPKALALDKTGNLYVLDGLKGRVHVYDPDGRFIRRFDLAGDNPGIPLKPRGIAVDSDGHVYVSDVASNNILIFDHDGAFIQAWGRSGGLPGDFWSPSGIFIDDRDMIYVADRMNGRVQVFQYSK